MSAAKGALDGIYTGPLGGRTRPRIDIATQRGVLSFPTSEGEAETMTTEELLELAWTNDPNGDWDDASRDDLIWQVVEWGLELAAEMQP